MGYMGYSKEDGNIDIEYIKKLPLEEKMKRIGMLTKEQYEKYVSSIPIVESCQPIRILSTNTPMGQRGVMADEFIHKIREEYGKKQC